MSSLAGVVVNETTISGIPTFWVEAAAPFTGVLYFRVGRWDETVLTRGITHLAEHLALNQFRDLPHPYNGMVAGNHTLILASGSQDQVSAFFARFGNGLDRLPLDRLTKEAGVLAAEAMARPTSIVQHLLAVLYGPNGPGLDVQAERGLWRTGPTELAAWVAKYFNKQNVVLALTGKPPPDLLVPLPDGEPQPFALPGDDVGYRPETLEHLEPQHGGISLGGIVRRSVPMVMATSIVEDRLNRRLRHDLGIVYSPVAIYDPIDKDAAMAFFGADAQPSNIKALNLGFLETVRQFNEDGPNQVELDRFKQKREHLHDRDQGELARSELHRLSLGALLGDDTRTLQEIAARQDATSADEIRQAWRAFMDSAFLVPPIGAEVDTRQRRVISDTPIDGRRFRSSKAAREKELRVGPSGISMKSNGRWTSIKWKDLVLAERQSKDVWTLMSRLGSWMQVDGSNWRRTDKLTASILEYVPVDVIDRPPPA